MYTQILWLSPLHAGVKQALETVNISWGLDIFDNTHEEIDDVLFSNEISIWGLQKLTYKKKQRQKNHNNGSTYRQTTEKEYKYIVMLHFWKYLPSMLTCTIIQINNAP